MALINDKEVRLVQNGFGQVEIEKPKLLETIRANREKHIQEYTEASKKYNQATLAYALEFVKQLEENIKEVKATMDAKLAVVQSAVGLGEEAYAQEKAIDFKDINSSVSMNLNPKVQISVSRPESHEKEYNTVIKNLELSTAEFVVLGQSDFNQYVLDEWVWKSTFSNNNYLIGSGTTMTGNMWVNNAASGIFVTTSGCASIGSSNPHGLTTSDIKYSAPLYSSSILSSSNLTTGAKYREYNQTA
jgi:hypothetical protein